MPTDKRNERDEDVGKGAVEQDGPGQETNVSFAGQSGHRDQDPLLKSSDTDFPEPGQNEEHTGEPEGKNQLAADTSLRDCGKENPKPNSPEAKLHGTTKKPLPAD